MKAKFSGTCILAPILCTLLIFTSSAQAADLKVMTSGGFTSAYRELAPEFERKTGYRIETAYGASMGNAADSIPNRLRRGEAADVVILALPALDQLVKEGKVLAGSRVDLAESIIGLAVRAGSPRPRIDTVEAFKSTLLNAKSIAYSGSASGVYLSTELFQRLGIADKVLGKCKKIENEMVGTVVARGDAEIGFQQISELLPIPGIEVVGPLPPQLQKVTVFSGGIVVGAKEPEVGRQLLRFFASRQAVPVIEKSGLHVILRQSGIAAHSGPR